VNDQKRHRSPSCLDGKDKACKMRHCNTNQSHLEGEVTGSNKKDPEDMQSGFIDKSMISVFSSSREVRSSLNNSVMNLVTRF
jgi:hypothetical protein